MPRYLVEHHFENGLQLPVDATGAEVCRTVIGHNGDVAVTWIHSYVSDDKATTDCIYDGPNAEAHSQGRVRHRPPRRPHHQGQRARPVLLPLTRPPNRARNGPRMRVCTLVAALTAALARAHPNVEPTLDQLRTVLGR